MCEPISLGTALASAAAGAAGVVAAPLISGNTGGSASSQSSAPSVAPAKTDADLATAAEEERRRMSLSTLGFGANFQDKLGSMGAFTQAPVSRLTLG